MRAHLDAAFLDIGQPLSNAQADAFLEYASLLQRWGSRINLTTVLDSEQIVTHHFVDSALVLGQAEVVAGDTVADIGSGAWFPGVPVALMRPEAEVVLFEASGKKSAFLASVVADLGLHNVEVVTQRVEPDSIADAWRNRFTWVFSRYTAPIRWLASCASQMTQPGGCLVAHKYDDPDERAALERLDTDAGVVRVDWRPDARAVPRRCFAHVQF